MSHRIWIAIAIGALCLGLVGGYLVANHSDIERRSDMATSAPPPDRKVLYWHDPMVPGTKFDKPGKSPFMDMQLVPVYAGEDGTAAVQIEPGIAQNLGIRLGRVETRAIERKLHAVGNVVVDERRVQVVQTRVAGTVKRLHVRSPLAQVKRGQLLAEVVSPEWIGAQQEYLALLGANTASSKLIREAARERLEVLGIPGESIRAIEASRTVSGATNVLAPIDGVITQLAIREGAAFEAGGALFEITDLQSVWVTAQIPESQVSLLAEASNAGVTATAWPGTTFEGRLIALLPGVDPQTRTASARVEVANESYKLSPGMYVSLEFAHSGDGEQLVVPSEAVIVTGQRSAVIVAREGGGFDVAEVEVGNEADGYTAIRSGLSEGQSVVLSGQFLIDSEASLKATVNRLGSDPTDTQSPDANSASDDTGARR